MFTGLRAIRGMDENLGIVVQIIYVVGDQSTVGRPVIPEGLAQPSSRVTEPERAPSSPISADTSWLSMR